jgi:hypothetical protein
VAAVGAGLTLLAPGLLRGTAAMNGSARGTALVVLAVGVPALIASMAAVSGGAVRPVITWLGATAFTLYQSVLFLFATPFNRLFLAYVAMFALSAWTLVTLLKAVDVDGFVRHYAAAFPNRALAAYLGVLAVLNALAWLVQVVPATFRGGAPAFLAGSGLTTSPVYVQDLSFWIPLMAVSAAWLRRRRAWGYVLVGAMLVFGVIESISIAVDQWMGSAADPSSTVASASLTPIFTLVAAIGLVPLFFYFRNLHR